MQIAFILIPFLIIVDRNIIDHRDSIEDRNNTVLRNNITHGNNTVYRNCL